MMIGYLILTQFAEKAYILAERIIRLEKKKLLTYLNRQKDL